MRTISWMTLKKTSEDHYLLEIYTQVFVAEIIGCLGFATKEYRVGGRGI